MEKTRNKSKELLPYGMLLTRLFKYVVSVFPELAIDHYLLHDRVMHPLAPHYKQKMRSDHGKKRPHESNASSFSTTVNHPSSSCLLDDTIDKNDNESIHSNSFSPSQNVYSLSNVALEYDKKDKIQAKPHKDHAFACLCHMLYCIESLTSYNLAFFILKRMEKTRNKSKELLPYGMLLTRLFKYVVSVFLELAIDHYLLHDRVMHPLAPYYKQKMRSDHGKKRPYESNASSFSTTVNHPSSSCLLDDTIDENDDESIHSNSFSPSQNVSSLSNVVLRVRQNPPHESHNLKTYLFETINLQAQQRDAHREGLRSIGLALKNMMSGKQK
nr:pentatricopeptide repeat-containing protein [Tanacetum cinerariifolium]